jgi:hypothetical protein
LDDNQGIPFEEAYDHRMMPADKPDDNQGHVDPSSQNLMMGKSYVEGNAISLSSKRPPPYVQLFDLSHVFRNKSCTRKSRSTTTAIKPVRRHATTR